VIRLAASDGAENSPFVGADISFRDYVNQTKITLKPVFSTGLSSHSFLQRQFLKDVIVNVNSGAGKAN
jgi:hypothetical protein